MSIGENVKIPLKQNYEYTKKSTINRNWSLCFLSNEKWSAANERSFRVSMKGMRLSKANNKKGISIVFGYCELKDFQKESFASFKYSRFKCKYLMKSKGGL